MELIRITGKTMKFGPNMNTDIIIPSQYLEDKDPKIFCKYLMAAIRPTTFDEIQEQGDTIFVADIDFGSGSSREQAPDAIKYAGVKLVIAESFASIFYRNSINVGLPILEAPGIVDFVDEGDELEINLEKAEINNITKSTQLKGKMIEKFLLNKLLKGGLIPELKAYVKTKQLDS